MAGTIATATPTADGRSWERVDSWLTVGGLVVMFVVARIAGSTGGAQPAIQSLFLSALLLQPILLLRAVEQARDVPRPAWWAALVGVSVLVLLVFLFPRPRPQWLTLSIAAFVLITHGFGAVLLQRESRRSGGLSAWRLRAASIGAWLFVAVFLLIAARSLAPRLAHSTLGLLQVTTFAMFAAYGFGFATPRRIRREIQRAELYRFLKQTSERNPAERGVHAAADLAEAASRSVATSDAAVFIGRESLISKGASRQTWLGITIRAGKGLIGRAHSSRQPVVGTLAEVEPGLAHLHADAARVLAIPIVADDDGWGVLLVAQRRRVLFVQDDIELLSRLCRYTAEALDHSQLLAEERDRQQREADAKLRETESRLDVVVNEQKQLEERLRQSQKLESIGLLAGGVAHDFNNMLTVILGYAAATEEVVAPEHRAGLAEIRKAAERATGLTRQLLAFSRRQVLQPRLIHMGEVVSSVLPMLRPLLGEAIEIAEFVQRSARPVFADPSQLEQILVNLAVNARDAMPASGRLTIRVAHAELNGSTAALAVEVPGPHTMLEVTDTGVGMDEETKARIFEPFFTTKEFGRGTGLGLSMVYGAIKQMNGTLSVESAPGRGTTFKLYVPCADEAAIQAPVELVPAVRTMHGSETVMVVEDEPGVRSLVATVLKKAGYRVITAESAGTAMATLAQEIGEVHLVITDVVMPGGTGPELVNAVTTLRPGIKALFMSGYAEPALRQGQRALGQEFLQKPFSREQILAKVRESLDRAN